MISFGILSHSPYNNLLILSLSVFLFVDYIFQAINTLQPTLDGFLEETDKFKSCPNLCLVNLFIFYGPLMVLWLDNVS